MHSIFLPRTDASASRSPILHLSSRSPRPRITPVPYAEWALWAEVLRKFRRPSDAGLGDTIVHLIGDTRSQRFKIWFQRKFGKSCGCIERQRWLNQKFPYAKI